MSTKPPRRVTIRLAAREPGDLKATLQEVVEAVRRRAGAATGSPRSADDEVLASATVPDEHLETRAREVSAAALNARDQQIRQKQDVAGCAAAPKAQSAMSEAEVAPNALEALILRLQAMGIGVTAELLSESLARWAQHQAG